jgi:hypothetical protein
VANAATLAVLVKADGIGRLQKQLTGVHGDLERTAGKARGAGDELEKTGKRGSSAMRGLKTAAGALAGLAAFDAVGKGVGAMVSEFQEARKVGAQTTAVLKSTGGAANVTARQVQDLAGSLSRKVGVDDEAIQSGQNLLLTFTRVRNETGRGNDIFNQATKTLLDMSTALGQDTKTSAIQLGKALNDPVKGITALRRVGVSFTKDQQAMITRLAESGRTLDAQKIILRELNKEFGGSAAAAATPLDHLRVSIGNLAEAGGAVLVPALDKAAQALTVLFTGMVEGQGVGGALISVFRGVGTALGELGAAFVSVIGWFKQHETVALALASAVGVVSAALVTMRVVALAQMIPTLAATASAWVALNAAMLLNPFTLVVVGLAALVAALVVAYRESETFRTVVQTAFRAVGDVAKWLWNAIRDAFNGIVTVIRTSWQITRDVTTTVWNGIRSFLTSIWQGLRSTANAIWDAIRSVITGAMTAARDALTAIWSAIRSVASTAWSGVRDSAVMWWNGVRDAITTPIRAARDVVSEVWSQIRSRASEAWAGLKSGASQFASEFRDIITGAFKGAAKLVGGFAKKILEVVNVIPGVNLDDAIKKVDGFISGLAKGGVYSKGLLRVALLRARVAL